MQDRRQMREGSPQPCDAGRQHATTVPELVLAHGQARCQRSPRDPSRLCPEQTIWWGRRGVKQAQLQSNTRGHDIHSRSQHGTWRIGHVVANRARWQDRRRLASATLAAAHTPRHIGERLGNHVDEARARSPVCSTLCFVFAASSSVDEQSLVGDRRRSVFTGAPSFSS